MDHFYAYFYCFISEFFQHYPSSLSNQQKSKIRHYFIELIEHLDTRKIIQSNYKYISKNIYYSTNKLTSENITEGFVIYERLEF